MTVRDVLRSAMKPHQEEYHGLVCNPEKLLDLQVAALRKWLDKERRSYEEGEDWAVGLALKDIIHNQME